MSDSWKRFLARALQQTPDEYDAEDDACHRQAMETNRRGPYRSASEGWSDWIDAMNKYALSEAPSMVEAASQGPSKASLAESAKKRGQARSIGLTAGSPFPKKTKHSAPRPTPSPYGTRRASVAGVAIEPERSDASPSKRTDEAPDTVSTSVAVKVTSRRETDATIAVTSGRTQASRRSTKTGAVRLNRLPSKELDISTRSDSPTSRRARS